MIGRRVLSLCATTPALAIETYLVVSLATDLVHRVAAKGHPDLDLNLALQVLDVLEALPVHRVAAARENVRN